VWLVLLPYTGPRYNFTFALENESELPAGLSSDIYAIKGTIAYDAVASNAVHRPRCAGSAGNRATGSPGCGRAGLPAVRWAYRRAGVHAEILAGLPESQHAGVRWPSAQSACKRP